jgi:hypothetical protein
VLAIGDGTRIESFDAALADVLAHRFPEPLSVRHRVFVISGRK